MQKLTEASAMQMTQHSFAQKQSPKEMFGSI